VAVAAGGPLSLIEHRVSGLLCPPDAPTLADATLRRASRRLKEAAMLRDRSCARIAPRA
jgi:hypothetical protein